MFIRKNKILNILVLLLVVLFYTFFKSDMGAFNNNVKSKAMPIYKVETENKNISITFDVNWCENDYLYDILDVLDKYDVKATFFIMGKWVVYPEENLEKLKEIYNRGHEIGNHSYIHPDFTNIDKERMKREIEETESIIMREIGVKTTLFRFPSGSFNENSVNEVKDLGYIPIQWSADSVDWKNLSLEKEYNKIIKEIDDGGIMLFHNNGKYTADNLDKLIPKLKGEGYEFVKVGELIYKDNYLIDDNGIQRNIK